MRVSWVKRGGGFIIAEKSLMDTNWGGARGDLRMFAG